jgi:hypothetical protein
MSISRRSFTAEAPAASLLVAFSSKVRANLATLGNSEELTAGENYWSSLYNTEGNRGRKSVFGDELRDPRFAFFDDKNGLRWVEDNKPEDLPSFNDDAVVGLELGGFRVGKLDEGRFSGVRYAQLHLSCQQVKGLDFIGPLAWASLATVFADKAKKLPSVQDLNFSPQASSTMPGGPQLNRVLLPGGAGHLSVNITTTPTSSMLDKILSVAVQVTKIVAPLFGFPAISIPALNAFTDFYGKLEKATSRNFLMNTSLKDVAVTQIGAHDPNVSVKAINLLSGYYILVPKSQEALLANEMNNLIMQNGYLIQRKDSGSAVPPDERVNNAVPNMTYVTLHVDVKPASSFTSTTKTKTSDAAQPTDNSAGKSHSSENSKKKSAESNEIKPQ